MSQLHVSIIGAGISGLVLGRCLLQRGVKAVLFEKAKRSPRRNDYGITLHSSTYGPLLKILDLDERTFRQQVAVDSAIGGVGSLGSHEQSSFRANRNRFEQLISEGLEVRWEHELENVQHDAEGRATIHFKNGQKHSSPILIGADGPHSTTRSLISADTKLKILPFATYNGKRRVSAGEFETKFAPAMQDRCVLEKRLSDALLQISVSNRDRDEVSISYTYSRPGQGSEDLLYRPDRSKDQAREVPEALFQEIDRLSAELEEPYKSVFLTEALRNDRLLNWLMRSLHLNVAETLSDAAATGVVLVGDAVHSEPILGGQGWSLLLQYVNVMLTRDQGANLAIEDSLQLAELIAQHQGINLTSFYSSQSTRWEKSVAESEARIDSMHTKTRPSL